MSTWGWNDEKKSKTEWASEWMREKINCCDASDCSSSRWAHWAICAAPITVIFAPFSLTNLHVHFIGSLHLCAQHTHTHNWNGQYVRKERPNDECLVCLESTQQVVYSVLLVDALVDVQSGSISRAHPHHITLTIRSVLVFVAADSFGDATTYLMIIIIIQMHVG